MKDLREVLAILEEIGNILGVDNHIDEKEFSQWVSDKWRSCDVKNSGLAVCLWLTHLYEYLTGKSYKGYTLFKDLGSVLGFRRSVYFFEDFIKELYRYLGGKE